MPRRSGEERRRRRTAPPAVAPLAVLVVLAVASVAVGCGDDEAPPPTTLRPPDERDIAYGPELGCGPVDAECGGSQELDVYRSSRPGPNPVMLWLHGGGGVSGDKTVETPGYLQDYLDDGWDVVGVNYRLATKSGDNRFPVGLQDAKRAVRWVRANAAANDWDPARVAVTGHSTGGNLAQLLATTADEVDLAPPDLPPDLAAQSDAVLAAVSVAPVSVLSEFNSAGWMGMSVDQYLGCSVTCPERMERASVPVHVDPTSAPVLALHGEDDPWAAPSQGEAVQAAFDAAGIGERFELVVADEGPESNRGHTPELDRYRRRVAAFLERA